MNSQPPAPLPGPFQLPASGAAALPIPYVATFGAAADTTESAIRYYWRIFYQRRWILLAVTAACVALGILLAMMTQRQYAASATIEVSREASKILPLGSVEAERPSYDPEFYQTQYALLKARSLAESVVRELRLADNIAFLNNYRSGDAEELAKLPRAQRFAIATSIVSGGLTVEPVRLSSVINLRFASPNPAMAAAVANSLAENFIESNLSRRFEATAYARQFLQNRLNQVRTKLEDSERKAAAYAQREQLIKVNSAPDSLGLSSEQSLATADLAGLSAQLAMVRAERVQAEAQFRSGLGGGVAAETLSNSTINQLRQQRGELIGQLSKLTSDFGPEYPPVAALRAQISELDRQIAREQSLVGSSVAQNFGGKFRQALATEQALQARVNQLKGEVLDQQQRSIQYNIIQRDVDTNRALYDALLQRFKEIGIAGGIGTNNISIIDRAKQPAAPFKPNLRLNIILGLLIGLLAGAVLALILEQLDEATVLPADFQRKLGVPLLGSTPKVEAGDVHGALGQSKSALSEAYFSILTAIQFSTSHGTPSSLLLTSTQPREGKTTTAIALAQGLASVGARVLLIDGDMRNPSLHRFIGAPLRGGLSNLLTGDGDIASFVQESSTPNLWVMTSGQIPPNPAELLATETIGQVIEAATKLYDHVVVDGPPILGLADAPLLSRAVEGTVFVVESTRTRATQARHAIERLLAVRGNVIGAILSKFDMQNAGYGYGYGYDYQHGK